METDWEVRHVRECGRIRRWSEAIFIGKALAGESIALEPQQDGLWKVWFFDYPIGILDERKRKTRKLPMPTPAAAGKGARLNGAHEALPYSQGQAT